MKNLFNLSIILIFVYINTACSQKNSGEDRKILDNSNTPENLYEFAMLELDNKNYESAKKQFEEIEFKYPLTNEAVQSQIMSAFIDYAQMNYEEAIFKFNKVINRYPSHKIIDFTFYMRAMCYFEQIENEYLDGNNNIKALENFSQVINRFPDSKYARDSEQKILLVKENMAAKHMNIGMFYLNQQKHLAAMKRFKIIIDDFSKSKFTPEALHRLVEIYFFLGMIEDAKKTTAVLGYNYPDSEWYAHSYNLGCPKDSSIKNDTNFFNKISNFLNKDD